VYLWQGYVTVACAVCPRCRKRRKHHVKQVFGFCALRAPQENAPRKKTQSIRVLYKSLRQKVQFVLFMRFLFAAGKRLEENKTKLTGKKRTRSTPHPQVRGFRIYSMPRCRLKVTKATLYATAIRRIRGLSPTFSDHTKICPFSLPWRLSQLPSLLRPQLRPVGWPSCWMTSLQPPFSSRLL